jgi:hypothetical protein
MFGIENLYLNAAAAQMNAMRSLLPPLDASVIIRDLVEQGERKVDRLTFWMAALPDWIEPLFIMKMVRKLEAITDQLEHFAYVKKVELIEREDDPAQLDAQISREIGMIA